MEIQVHGGGVAGSAAAILLARAGHRVSQHVARDSRRQVPPEILSPWSLTLLDRLGLPSPEQAERCGGVLSLWGEDEPDFHDYVMTTTRCGLAANRSSFQRELGAAARAAGVVQVEARARGAAVPVVDREEGAYHLLANGRSSPSPRRLEDRLVAMFMPCEDDRSSDRLMIEAVEDGWWYLPPQAGATRFAVLVTDREAMAVQEESRGEWLRSSLGRTNLIAAAAGAIDADLVAGVDARVATAETAVWPSGARLGDSAIALDPLSGTGIARALEGASVITTEIVEYGRAGPAYRAWLENTHAEEVAIRTSIYARATERFQGAPFWSRRMSRMMESRSGRANVRFGSRLPLTSRRGTAERSQLATFDQTPDGFGK